MTGREHKVKGRKEGTRKEGKEREARMSSPKILCMWNKINTYNLHNHKPSQGFQHTHSHTHRDWK